MNKKAQTILDYGWGILAIIVMAGLITFLNDWKENEPQRQQETEQNRLECLARTNPEKECYEYATLTDNRVSCKKDYDYYIQPTWEWHSALKFCYKNMMPKYD